MFFRNLSENAIYAYLFSFKVVIIRLIIEFSSQMNDRKELCQNIRMIKVIMIQY